MKATKRAGVLSLTFGLLFGLIAGCNSLIGAGAPNPVESFGGAGGSSENGGAPTIGRECVLASDCPGAQICLFRLCSKQCDADKDCLFGRCLQTEAGNACVIAASAVCTSDDNCPTGSVCRRKACRSSCTTGAQCLSDQSCLDGACVGNDVAHDPVTPTGAGGDSGEAGASGGPAEEAGASNGGTAGSGGAISTGGSAGSNGKAGSGGMSGGGGVPDGTAIGSLGATCDKNGALACAGHAKRVQLICQNGVWQSNGTCAGSNLCDSTPGDNAGSCQPMISECSGQTAGFRFCRGTDAELRACGLDLVTATVLQSCTYVCASGTCTGECHPKAKQCKAGGTVPQTCTDGGTWNDETACAYQCDATSGNCIAAGCKDGVKNGDETDKDCGGSCGGCPVGGLCQGNGDCLAPASAHCLNGKCAAAICGDLLTNGNETDKDCGGSCPADCAVGAKCAINADCALPESGHCSGTTCAAATCTDGVLNGNETGKDCGGSCAADCPLGDGCVGDADCVSGACLSAKCVVCKPLTKKCAGTAVQTCTTAGDYGNAVACSVANGVASCNAGACGVASCNPGFGNCDAVATNGCEVNLNAPGACGTTCANRIACSMTNGVPSCPNGACVMACYAGYGDCSTAANDGCEKVLNSVTSCGTCGNVSMCNAPAQKCAGGVCAPNTSYILGNSSTVGWSEFDPPADNWYLVPVSVPRDATVVSFRLIGLAAGGLARMALWADNGSGSPGAFLAQTGNITVAAGMLGAAPAPKPPATVTQISGGKTYWVGAKFTGGARVYQNSSVGAVTRTLGQAFSANPVSTLDPFPLGSSGVTSGTIYNLLLEVQDIPQ